MRLRTFWLTAREGRHGRRAAAPPTPGAPRRVGVEIEFAGLDGREVAGLARQVYCGALQEDDPYRYRLRGSGVGDLTVELDMSAAHLNGNAGEGLGERVKQAVHQAVGAVGSLVMPFEVVFPPPRSSGSRKSTGWSRRCARAAPRAPRAAS